LNWLNLSTIPLPLKISFTVHIFVKTSSNIKGIKKLNPFFVIKNFFDHSFLFNKQLIKDKSISSQPVFNFINMYLNSIDCIINSLETEVGKL
jgi:hypothetical protein